MKNISENYEFRSIDPSLKDKNKIDNNSLFSSGKALPSSKEDINYDKSKQNNQSINFSSTSIRTTTFNQDNNTSSFSLQENEYYLFGNNFSLIKKPHKLGKIRVGFYINSYPLISLGNDIFYPLLLILFICLLYIVIWMFFFHDSGYLLKKLFNYFFVFYLVFHILAISVNPGIPSFNYHQIIKHDLEENKANKFNYTKCKKCKLFYKLKDNIGHCKLCNICYFGYERHSFWIGHCIGLYNKFFFICFVLSFWTFIMLCLTMVFVKILKIFFINKNIY